MAKFALVPDRNKRILIRIRDLDFAYPTGSFRLELSSLDITSGERLAIVGASGSGKTTLLDLMAGIRLPSSGSIQVLGTEITTMSDAERRAYRIRRVGLIFQAFELLDYLTVEDNVLLPYRLSAALPDLLAARARVDTLARDTQIRARLRRYPGQLSQGEQQRVAICRALITAPSLILADEPTGNLDPDNKQRVLNILLDQVSRHRATLVMVTHDHDLLERFDNVVDMRTFRTGEPG